MPRKKKNKEELTIDGKLKPKYTTIAEVLGQKDQTYKTNSRDEYKKYLDLLNVSELFEEAIKVADIRPNPDRRRLSRALLDAFDRHQRKINASRVPEIKTPEITAEVKRLMNPF